MDNERQRLITKYLSHDDSLNGEKGSDLVLSSTEAVSDTTEAVSDTTEAESSQS